MHGTGAGIWLWRHRQKKPLGNLERAMDILGHQRQRVQGLRYRLAMSPGHGPKRCRNQPVFGVLGCRRATIRIVLQYQKGIGPVGSCPRGQLAEDPARDGVNLGGESPLSSTR